jgi:hypothetical protein
MPSSQNTETNTSKTQTELARSQGDGCPSETETVSSKPWASGRTLTAAQRTRKRAVDNRTHQERRNRTQSRISELEAKLEALLKDKADKGGTKARCEKANHEARSQRLEHMPDLIATSCNMQDCIINEAPALDSTNQTVLAAPELLSPSNVGQLPRTSAQGMVIDPSTISSIGACESMSTTQLCNMELSKVSHLTSNRVCRDELVNQDFIIRAVLQGWETIDRRGCFCPLWEILHHIDDLIFCTSSSITRLVMLYTVHRMLLVSRLKF